MDTASGGLMSQSATRTIDNLVPRQEGAEQASTPDPRTTCPLPGGGLLTRVERSSGSAVLTPLVPTTSGWRRARPGDGVSATLLTAGPPLLVEQLAPWRPSHGEERALPGEQTNELVVVDEEVVVKWQVVATTAPVAPTALAHLAAVGFTDITPPVATVSWDGVLVAQVLRYLPGAEDGWRRLATRVRTDVVAGRRPPVDLAAAAGDLLGRCHAAMTRPSPALPQSPPARDGAALAAGYEDLHRQLLAAGDQDTVAALAGWEPTLTAALAELRRPSSAPAIHCHGDAHIGQFLPWREGLALSDFDGSPLVPAADRGRPTPAAVDIAALRRSLAHLALTVSHELDSGVDAGLDSGLDTGALLRDWSRLAQEAALDAYRAAAPAGLLDEGQRTALEQLSVLHELGYAARFEPEWRAVPLAVLRDGPLPWR